MASAIPLGGPWREEEKGKLEQAPGLALSGGWLGTPLHPPLHTWPHHPFPGSLPLSAERSPHQWSCALRMSKLIVEDYGTWQLEILPVLKAPWGPANLPAPCHRLSPEPSEQPALLLLAFQSPSTHPSRLGTGKAPGRSFLPTSETAACSFSEPFRGPSSPPRWSPDSSS